MDRPGAVAALRAAVAAFAATYATGDERWCVALSGGPDSLALTAAAAELRPTTALIVDHRLQTDSARIADTAREQALRLGCVDAQVLRVDVGAAGGPEAAARSARYAALEAARDAAPVLLGHTLDDQAETVLLGLGRGSGARSIAGIRPCDPPWYRPLLGGPPGHHRGGVRRVGTHAVAGPAQHRPPLHPQPAARRGAAAARGRPLRRCRRSAGPHRHRPARGQRRAGRPGPRQRSMRWSPTTD